MTGATSVLLLPESRIARGEAISTSANAFTLVVGELLESSDPSTDSSIFKNNTSEWVGFFFFF